MKSHDSNHEQSSAKTGADKPIDSDEVNGPHASEPFVQKRKMTRRSVLQLLGVGATASAGMSYLPRVWAADSGSAGAASGKSDPELTIATKNNPVTYPITADNPPIPSGRSPEKGPLNVYVWSDYLSPAVVKSFEERYGVQVNVSHYSSISEAINKIALGKVPADVWVPTVTQLGQAVRAQLIQPLNHSYIPNFSDVIPSAADPWYDKGSHYSTPNYTASYGCAWRKDLIDIKPELLSVPWEVYWKVPQDTPIGMMSGDPSPAIMMALLSLGKASFDRVSKKDILAGARELQKLKGVRMQYTAFQPLGEGIEKLAYCYSGDMTQIGSYLPSDVSLDDVQYFFPKNGFAGIVEDDMWVISKNSKNPVLAHMFLNHRLELESAIANFRDEGYQTMLKDLTIEKLKAAKAAEPHAIEMAYVSPTQQQNAISLPLYNSTQQRWFADIFHKLKAGLGV